MVTPDVYPRPVCAEKNAVMSTARFLLIYEELVPPGAASGGQQGAQRADASVRLEGALCERAAGGDSLASLCGCGGRPASRVGAIPSCALRCA